MRECPSWFQDELTRIGGTNPHGEPVFKLVWSTTERTVIGGKWQKDGFVGYRQTAGVPGPPCWALMVWEPCELQGTLEQWNRQYADPETGLLQCGGYPKYGRYRVLQRFIHRELAADGLRTYRMEPCGLMLDIMLPGLIRWLQLTNAAKTKVLQEEERLENEAFLKVAKDVMAGCRISRGSQLVQKRAEIIERGFKQAMAYAARTGLGMRMEN
jgi:hypothetical protein